jgi:hypothetical protein
MRDISECDEFPGPPPEIGTYWTESHVGLCRVIDCHYDDEVLIQTLPEGEEMYELLAVFCTIYHPVSDEELPLHLLGAV